MLLPPPRAVASSRPLNPNEKVTLQILLLLLFLYSGRRASASTAATPLHRTTAPPLPRHRPHRIIPCAAALISSRSAGAPHPFTPAAAPPFSSSRAPSPFLLPCAASCCPSAPPLYGHHPTDAGSFLPTSAPTPLHFSTGADAVQLLPLQLLRFQKEWFAWALAQEASVSRGGILADEMGMGMTIQGISLVLTARRLRPPGPPPPSAGPSLLLGPPMRRVGCTLVICPVVAVIQWGGKKGKGRSGYKRKSGVEEEDYEEWDEELGSQSRGQSPLHSVRWERIILDELRKWNERWVILDPTSGKMEYKIRRNETAVKGIILFDASSTITLSPVNFQGMPKYDGCCFYIGTPQKKDYFLCAETPGAAKAWMSDDEDDDKLGDPEGDTESEKLIQPVDKPVAPSCRLRSDHRKEKSLGLLTQNFVKLFLTMEVDTISLDEAAKLLLGEGHAETNMRTKVRRLYDIANVLSSLNPIEKTQQADTRKPAFRWLGTVGKPKAENGVTVAVPLPRKTVEQKSLWD